MSIPTLAELQELERLHGNQQYDPALHGLQSLIDGCRQAHWLQGAIDAREENARGLMSIRLMEGV
jgi:hypothetical protein